MSDRCSLRQSSAGSAARVGEKIQDPDGSSRFPDELSEPVPVGCLLRKEPGVLKTERLQVEDEIAVCDLPGLGQVEEFPAPAAFRAAVIVAVGILPASVLFFCLPDDLRVRTNQDIVAPSLKLFSVRGIQYFIIFPAVGYPHICAPVFIYVIKHACMICAGSLNMFR